MVFFFFIIINSRVCVIAADLPCTDTTGFNNNNISLRGKCFIDVCPAAVSRVGVGPDCQWYYDSVVPKGGVCCTRLATKLIILYKRNNDNNIMRALNIMYYNVIILCYDNVSESHLPEHNYY